LDEYVKKIQTASSEFTDMGGTSMIDYSPMLGTHECRALLFPKKDSPEICVLSRVGTRWFFISYCLKSKNQSEAKTKLSKWLSKFYFW